MSVQLRRNTKHNPYGFAEQPFSSLDVRITVVQDDKATIAHVNYRGIEYTASAKRAPGDQRSPGLGSDLAIGRVLQKLGTYLEGRSAEIVQQEQLISELKQARRHMRHLLRVSPITAAQREAKKAAWLLEHPMELEATK